MSEDLKVDASSQHVDEGDFPIGCCELEVVDPEDLRPRSLLSSRNLQPPTSHTDICTDPELDTTNFGRNGRGGDPVVKS